MHERGVTDQYRPDSSIGGFALKGRRYREEASE
jgi:hypothetical protein